ncbi:hypothetical protein FRC11_011353 [Ceratobasidium sp. 423]|nr:hypothetical protein FRC11_011353 [Ceratobasidium sp. 423]
MLGCGHPCPSVCGEPCEQQTCKTCGEDTASSIVDMLKQVHLRDLENDVTLDSMTLTLPCRHVFTVEMLDSITRIHDFYERDGRGEWTKATMPDASDIRSRPVCPRCGGGIDSLRYGRILKHSNHSVLQYNITRHLSDQLSNSENMLSEVRGGLEGAVTEAIGSLASTNFPAPSETTRRNLLERMDTTLAANEGRPTSIDIVENLSKFHGFPPRHTRAWRKAINEISKPYRVAHGVACEPDPSVQAYETSLGRLYLDELNKNGGSSARTTDPAQLRLQDLAAKVAHIRIGHPRPRARDRFAVEAFWVTVEILALLGLATSKACEELRQRNAAGANVSHWENVAEFILLRATKDAETAHRLANESKSHNKAIICRRLILQTQYEHAAHKCRVAIRNGAFLNRETRDEYLDMYNRGIEQIQELQTSVPREYQGRVQRGAVLGVTEIKAEWVRGNFVRPAQGILEAWNNLIRAIQNDMPGWGQEQAYGNQLVLWRPVVQEHAALNRKWGILTHDESARSLLEASGAPSAE